MKHFQNIAIGLLGLTNPEMFIPSAKPSAPTNDERPASGGSGGGCAPRKSRPARDGAGARAIRSLRLVMTALAIGSRSVALADNTELRRDLKASARLLYGSGEG